MTETEQEQQVTEEEHQAFIDEVGKSILAFQELRGLTNKQIVVILVDWLAQYTADEPDPELPSYEPTEIPADVLSALFV